MDYSTHLKRRPSRSSKDGEFLNSYNNRKDQYKVCKIDNVEIRVWGPANGRGLERGVVAGVRAIVRRIGPERPIALMADYHPAALGVVGSVIPSERHIAPDLIGGDCGCGVFAGRLSVLRADIPLETLQQAYRMVVDTIPVGTNQYREAHAEVLSLPLWADLTRITPISAHDLRKLRLQFGSLGGGNHFIELAVDDDDGVWLMVHSGSRYLGGILRAFYEGRNLALGTPEATEFLRIQESVLHFARLSRKMIAQRTLSVLSELLGEVVLLDEIDLCHNMVLIEDYDNTPVAIHRKGACKAGSGEPGIIPGSMGTGSFIVEGRGNPHSYSSSSHGAGRVMSRSEAFRDISFRRMLTDMEGVIWSRSDKLKDEAPEAYKDINEVIAAQRDLVRVRCRLRPLLVVKGEE
jgi:tRNA-splicing ligase RtcB